MFKNFMESTVKISCFFLLFLACFGILLFLIKQLFGQKQDRLSFLKRYYKWRARFPMFPSFLLWEALYISLLIALLSELSCGFLTMNLVRMIMGCFFLVYFLYWLFKRAQYKKEHKFMPIWILQMVTFCFLTGQMLCWEYLFQNHLIWLMACTILVFPSLYALLYRWSLRRRF